MRQVKIWATLGPACAEEEVLIQMIEEGMDAIRLNLSHGNLENFQDWLQALHDAEKKTQKPIELLCDLKGPELRLKKRKDALLLKQGERISLEELQLPECVLPLLQEGMELEIDDGKIVLQVLSRQQAAVLQPGMLLSGKSLFIPQLKDLQASLPVLQPEDRMNLEKAEMYGVHSIMVPFVRSRKDLEEVRNVLTAMNLPLKIYAKIENLQGLENLETFIDLADCIVIARGDLANSTGLEKIAYYQHKIENICRKHQKDYLVVTQMLESMMEHPCPTRAEVNDIFTSVYNGAGSVMITQESAAGKFPAAAVKYLKQISKSALQALKEETI